MLHHMGLGPVQSVSVGGASYDEASILFDVRDAIQRRPSNALRADSATSAAVEVARRYSERIAHQGVVAGHLRADQAASFAADIQRGTMEGLGWSVADGRLRSDASSFAPGSLTDVEGGLIRPAYTERVLSGLLPVRMVDADAEFFQPSGSLSQGGKMALHRPGMTNVPYADAAVGYIQQPIHTLVIATRVDWREAMVGRRSAIDIAAEKAAAAKEIAANTQEQMIVNGLPGINFRSLANIGLVRIVSSVDYSSNPTMDSAYADLMRIVQRLREASDYAGSSPNVMAIGPRWAYAIRRLSNFAAGGSGTGSDLLATLAGANAGLAAAIGAAGITRIIEAPSLRDFHGDSTLDGMVLLNTSQPNGLRQVMAMPLSPVRSASSLTADETLWAMRTGGLDVQDGSGVAIAEATVA